MNRFRSEKNPKRMAMSSPPPAQGSPRFALFERVLIATYPPQPKLAGLEGTIIYYDEASDHYDVDVGNGWTVTCKPDWLSHLR